MNPQMIKLLDFEKKILENRRELQELTREKELLDDELMREKLSYLNQELIHMQVQLEFLKEGVQKQGCLEKAGQNSDAPVIEVPREENPSYVERQPNVKTKPKESVTNWKNGKDLEKTIGKSLMGIVASSLIFISFILFATLLLPYFNDTAKMFTAYIISFVFLGFGLWKLQKNKENKFYLALTGCGVGALYISLLLTNLYFKMIGDISLYVLISLWAAFVCFLSKLQNRMFQVIGQLGIFISMLFGCILCGENEDAAKFLALVIFYAISSSVFYIVHYNREFSKNLVHHVFFAINFLLLTISCYNVMGFGMNGATILILALMVSHIGVSFYSSMENSNISVGIILGCYGFCTLQILQLLLMNEDIYAVVAYIISMVFIILLLYKKVKGTAGKNIGLVLFASYATFCLFINETCFSHGMVPLLILPFLVLGFLKGKSGLKYVALFLFLIYGWNDNIKGMEQLLFGMVVVVTAFALLYRYKEQSGRGVKAFLHIVSVIFISVTVKRVLVELTDHLETAKVCGYFFATLFHFVVLRSPLGKNLRTKEEESPAIYNLVNLVLMAKGVTLLSSGIDGWSHFLVIVATIMTFQMNAKNFLDKKTHGGWGMYVGVKFTFLLVTILSSFDSANYVISIACFILAIISIVTGFFGEYKSLRVYGLMLSMISTFKLIMIDIHYANTLGNAFSFFASGILCFVISLIYNHIDKKMKEEKEIKDF